MKVENKLLGPLNGKSGDDDLAAPGSCLADNVREVLHRVFRLLMEPVAIGAFQHQVIDIGQKLRIPDNRLAVPAQIP